MDLACCGSDTIHVWQLFESFLLHLSGISFSPQSTDCSVLGYPATCIYYRVQHGGGRVCRGRCLLAYTYAMGLRDGNRVLRAGVMHMRTRRVPSSETCLTARLAVARVRVRVTLTVSADGACAN